MTEAGTMPREIPSPREQVAGLVGAAMTALAAQAVIDSRWPADRFGETVTVVVSADTVANVFRAKIQNKDDVERRFFVEAGATGTPLTVLNQSAGLVIAPQAEVTLPLTLLVDRRDYRGEFNFTLRLRSDDGKVSVANRCRTRDGYEEVSGVARRVDGRTDRLQVSFLPAALRWLPIGWGDYWVIELAPDYRYAVVGEPSRQYLWMLSRTPALSPEDRRAIEARLPAHGYDAARLVDSPPKKN